MCPSYMVTREEAHSTRGRARLLFEMMRGGLREGWRSEAVHEALDLCLSCKGCKGDCPVSVDVATYKAEFLAHYYRGRLRPRHAYAFGLVHEWARIGALAPGLANWLMSAPITARLIKWAAEVEPRRELPRFAPATFRAWWRARPTRNPDGPAVVLWADTFNDHWQPAVLAAAAEVLEQAGLRVLVPPGSLCCGRPLYDFGMLRRARRRLEQTLSRLGPLIDAGVPVVGVEPSCVAVFRDELRGLLPDSERSRRLQRQALHLDEFLSRLPGWQPPKLSRILLVQGHCHQKATFGLEGERSILRKMGAYAELLDAGCCGMAGAFGYERSHYPVSIAVGERKLLPAVRAAPGDVILLADGFSCREQIRQGTSREALHLAQVLQMASQQGPSGPVRGLPETGYAQAVPLRPSRSRLSRAAMIGGALAFGVWLISRRMSRA
jgi:Fe-S oxidoreductase